MIKGVLNCTQDAESNMKKIVRFLNPLARLGEKEYSILFPLVTTLSVFVLSEFYSYSVYGSPDAVGSYIIFVSTALIIYFAFHDGLKGGITSSLITICYFLYIIYTRNYQGDQLRAGIQMTGVLAGLFLILSSIIGWLKQNIDSLIDSEANEKRRLQAIIQQLPVGVVITDIKGKVIQVNKQVENLLGLKIPLGYEVGSNIIVRSKKLNKPINLSQVSIVKALSSGKPLNQGVFQIQKEDGKQVYLQVTVSPIRNRNEVVIAAASIINDITQQKELEELKDEFIGIASHELKTPLTSIKGYTQILERIIQEMGNDKAKQYLKKTNKYINRLSSLIGDLLDVSKIQAGKLEFNYSEYDFDEMIEEAIDSFQPFKQKYQIIKRGKSNIKVYGDSSRTEQVINNLLSNAIKYSPNGNKIIVTISSSNNQVTVGVKDFGIGIPANKKKEIFKRFYRLEDYAQKFSGLGIGLYISAEIISRQGGKIWVESVEGKGSTFYFSLPINRKNNK